MNILLLFFFVIQGISVFSFYLFILLETLTLCLTIFLQDVI